MVRLPSPPKGDRPDPSDPAKEREKFQSEIPNQAPINQSNPPHPQIPRKKPIDRTGTSDFIPTDTRRKLKDLILKSKDPRRALDSL
jgi:hypothetical protein